MTRRPTTGTRASEEGSAGGESAGAPFMGVVGGVPIASRGADSSSRFVASASSAAFAAAAATRASSACLVRAASSSALSAAATRAASASCC